MEPTTKPGDARRGEAGFTLVEALIATVVLIVGIIPIANLMLVSASSNSVGNQSTAATALATQQMEQLKLQHFRCQTGGEVECVPSAPPGPAVPPLAPGGSVTACLPGYCIQGAPGNDHDILGVGRFQTRWQIVAIDANTLFIRVRSEGQGVLVGQRSRAEFTTFRTCTVQGCP